MIPAWSVLYKASGRYPRVLFKEIMLGSCEAPVKLSLIDLFAVCLLYVSMSACAVLTHGLFHVIPQFSLNEVFTVFRKSKSQAAEKMITVRPLMTEVGLAGVH